MPRICENNVELPVKGSAGRSSGRSMIALLLAAGKSKRFGKDKLVLPLGGKPVFQWSLETLMRHPLISKVLVVGREIPGAKTRQESVWHGLLKIKKKNPEFLKQDTGLQTPEFLVIHNAANPFVTEDEIFQCAYFLQKHRQFDGVGVGGRIIDTVKIAVQPVIQKTLERNLLWEMQTPQLVRFKPFLAAHEKARKEKFHATDDLALLEWFGKKTAVIEASENNFKITSTRDYELAKVIAGDLPRNIRVGSAEDTHLFSRKHRGLVLGGIFFPEEFKLEADSDGDVALHAVASAISQALSRGSLGTFADSSVKDSGLFIKKILREMDLEKLEIRHLGLHFRGKNPKIDPLAEKLRISLSKLLKIPKEKIGITAETGEGLQKGLHCAATVTLAERYIPRT